MKQVIFLCDKHLKKKQEVQAGVQFYVVTGFSPDPAGGPKTEDVRVIDLCVEDASNMLQYMFKKYIDDGPKVLKEFGL